MKHKLHLLSFVATLLAMPMAHSEDSVHAFLKIDGIKGEATNLKHVDEIELAAFKFGVLQSLVSGTGGGGGAGKATFAPITIYKGIDSASPILFLTCATGQHRSQAVLTLTDHGRDIFKVRLVDVLIASCDVDSNNV